MKVKALGPHQLRAILREARRGIPVSAIDQEKAGPDPRCVGSLMITTAQRMGFLRDSEFPGMPDQDTLGTRLNELFPALAMRGVTGLIAGDIITRNDNGHFGEAWDVLDRAINREMGVRRAKRRDGQWSGQLVGAMVELN